VVSSEDRRGPQPPRQISPSLLPSTVTTNGLTSVSAIVPPLC